MPDDNTILFTDFRSVQGNTEAVEFIPYQLGGERGHLLRMRHSLEQSLALTIPLSGWHEIHIGFLGASSLHLRLSSDPTFSWAESSVSLTRKSEEEEEALWRVSDLTDVEFQFLPQVL